MSNYIDSIIQPNGNNPYSATYIPQPIGTLPSTGCALPAFTSQPLPTFSGNVPDNTKFCAPLFVQFPIVPAPFSLPENCPNGLTFNSANVNIFSSPTSTSSAGIWEVSASRSSDNFCTFDLNIPDIVIPCYPNGPTVSGAASIQVIDPNSGTTATSQISVQQNSACDWSLQGEAIIQLPVIPCPNGPTFAAGALKVTSTCPTLSNFIDYKPVTITKQTGSSCNYLLDLPTLQIPCYPDGPSFTGGLSVNITGDDSAAIVGTQAAAIGSSGCCNYNLGGIIDINIPCGVDGNTLSFRDWVLTDPTKQLSDPTHTVTVPGGTIGVTKPTFCENQITLPPISIPCLSGVAMSPIALSGMRFSDNTTSDLASLALSPTNSICDIGGPIHLPVPICEGGMTVYNTATVQVSNSRTLPTADLSNSQNYLYYNSLQLVKTTGTSGNECGFELAGTLNLGLGDVSFCSGLTVSNNVAFTVSGHAVPNGTLGIAAGTDVCNLQFTNTAVDLPTLYCPTGFQATNSFTIVDSSGKLIYDATNPGSSTTSLELSSNSCGVTLQGQLVIPSSGGAGVGMSNWNMDTPTPAGGAVSYTPPEGALASYFNTCSVAIATGTVPGTDSECWQLQYQSAPGPVFPGFTVIRCEETNAGNTALQQPSTSITGWSDQTYKVVPSSYLYQSTSSDNRYYVFGLDTPFQVAPNQTIFLEVVFNQGVTQDALSVAYAAICVGSLDFPITSGISTIPAVLPGQTAKFITPAQASTILNSTAASNAYVASCVSQIVGITNATAIDLRRTLLNSLTSIKSKGSTTATDAVNAQPYQLKAYLPLGSTNNVGTSTTNKIDCTSVDLVCSNTSSTGVTQKFGIKQLHKGHVGLTAVNNGHLVYNQLVGYSSNPPASLTNDPVTANPGSTLTLASQQEFVVAYPSPVTSSLLNTQASSLYSPTTITGSYATSMPVGVDSESLHVYYTTDGSIPTINTYSNKASKLYDPAKVGNTDRLIVASGGPVRVNWFMIYQDFSIAGVTTQLVPKN